MSCGCTGGEGHIGSLQAAAYGFANESARPMTFGEETVAVWMPILRGPWRARFACDFIASLYESVHSTRSPAKMEALDVFSSCARRA